LIVNGGHYMTRGHVIFDLLYRNIYPMSRNIFRSQRRHFAEANCPILPPYSPRSAAVRKPKNREILNSPPGLRIGFFPIRSVRRCVFFDTSEGLRPPDYTPVRSGPREDSSEGQTDRREEKVR
jgi:hypothetical protein